jgi:hypothetical protein
MNKQPEVEARAVVEDHLASRFVSASLAPSERSCSGQGPAGDAGHETTAGPCPYLGRASQTAAKEPSLQFQRARPLGTDDVKKTAHSRVVGSRTDVGSWLRPRSKRPSVRL